MPDIREVAQAEHAAPVAHVLQLSVEAAEDEAMRRAHDPDRGRLAKRLGCGDHFAGRKKMALPAEMPMQLDCDRIARTSQWNVMEMLRVRFRQRRGAKARRRQRAD